MFAEAPWSAGEHVQLVDVPGAGGLNRTIFRVTASANSSAILALLCCGCGASIDDVRATVGTSGNAATSPVVPGPHGPPKGTL